MPDTEDDDFELPIDDDIGPSEATQNAIQDFSSGAEGPDDFLDDIGIEQEGNTEEDSLAKPWMKFHEFHLITEVAKVRELIDACIEHGNCALDLETQGFDNRIEFDENGKPYTRHSIVGYCIGLKGAGYYIPVRHKWEQLYDSRGPNVDDVIGTEEEIKRLCLASQPVVDPEAAKIDPLGSNQLAEPPKCIIKFWHAKFDQEYLYPICGIDWWHPDSFEDGMLAAYTLYTDGIHGLKDNAEGKNEKAVGKLSIKDPNHPEREYAYEMIKFSDLFMKGTKKKDMKFELLQPKPLEVSASGWNCVLYGCSDGICTDLLCDQLVPKATDKKYKGWYRLEKQVVQAVRIMERTRVLINKDEISALLDEAERELQHYAEKIIEFAKDSGYEKDFNPASSGQLADLLFGSGRGCLDINPKPEMTTQGQYKTDEKTLERYAEMPDAPPVLTWVIKHRQINKVKGTYLENLARNTDEQGQLRLNFKQTGAATGRFTAPKGEADHGFAGVPIQGIPAKNDPKKPQVAHSLRRMFVSRSRSDGKKYVMAKVDYASQELRITASVSGEEKWIKEYVKELETGIPADLHFMTAQAFFPGLKKDDPDFKLKRGMGKCVHPDTLLDTDIGYRCIKDVAPFKAETDSFFDLPESDRDFHRPQVDNNPVVATYNGGVKPLVHVVTRKGIVTCTEEHRFMTADGELVRAGDLQKGLNLRPVELPTMPRVGGSGIKSFKLWKGTPYASYKTGSKEAYFAGVFLGDGSVSESGARITHGDVNKLDPFDRSYGLWQHSLKLTCEDIGLEPVCEDKSLYLGSRVVVKYLENLGLVTNRPDTKNGRMKNLRVPEWVVEGGQEKFLPFLGGLIDTDRSVGHQTRVVEFTTKDFVFAGQIATLAQACGLQLSMEATYNQTYERHYARIRFSVASSWELRKYLNYQGKIARLGEPVAKSMTTTTNDVLAVLPAGAGLCLDITMGTEEHLYRANGMLTHNTANFALVYGGGVGAVQRATGCDQVEGGRLLNAFHESVPKFSLWVKKQHQIVKKQKGVRTGFNRFIAIPDANISGDEIIERDRLRKEGTDLDVINKQAAWRDAKRIRSACERKSTNYPIQGSGADILKISLILLIKEFYVRGWLKNGGDDSVRLVMTVHDEIVFEILEDRVADAIPVLKKIMEYPSTLARWTVPLIAEPELGDSWNAKLDWISMLKGDKDHPVPDYLVGKTIDPDPDIIVLSKPRKKKEENQEASEEPTESTEVPTKPAPVVLEATPQPAPKEEEETQESAADEVTTPEPEPEPLPPSKSTKAFKRYAVFRLRSIFLTEDDVAGVHTALMLAKGEAWKMKKTKEMIPIELVDGLGNLLIPHKDGVLAYPEELGRKLRELHLGPDSFDLHDVD